MKVFSTLMMLMVMAFLAIPMPQNVYAQEQPNLPGTQLVITLCDANGHGIAQAELLVVDAQGTTIAQAFTDQTGTVIIPGVIAGEVRLVVRGMLADGTRLVQTGFDAEGMLLFVAGPHLQVDLLAEPHGAIVPDPASMISPDTPIDAFPTQILLPTTLAIPTQRVPMPTIQPISQPVAPGTSIPSATPAIVVRQPFPWLAIALGGLAIVIGWIAFRPSRRSNWNHRGHQGTE